MVQINESNMIFGDFEEDKIFKIEKSKLHKIFKLDNSQLKLKFILVIKGHEIEWLLPVSDALKKKLSYQNTIWKSEVIVMNDKIANKYNLVKSVVK